MNKELQQKIDACPPYILKQREVLKALISKYKSEYLQVKALDLSDIKLEFIALQDEYSESTTKMNKVRLQAERHAEECKLQARLDKRRDGESQETAKWKADILTAPEQMMVVEAQINHEMMRDLKYSVKSYLDSIIQRISVVKGEEFINRQV